MPRWVRRRSLLVRQAQLVEEPGVVEGEFAQVLVAVARGEVARGEIHLEEHLARVLRSVGALGSQVLHPLGRLPIGDARVVQSAGDEDGGVVLRLHLVDRAVGEHVVKVFWLVRVAPLLPLPRGEGDGRVAHGDDEVDERHPGEGRPEELGRLVDHVADEQAARGPALAAHASRRGPAVAHEGAAHVHKVVEGVALGEVLAALLVPLPPPLLRPAPHVRHGEDHAAVHEGEGA
mmetsp:Transcript_20029/g.59155  ORF Transcript_20029/g.59155 Transcript_20029/m.59155 type:complete len:233 (-) Transcript_20029:1625-2323(-)